MEAKGFQRGVLGLIVFAGVLVGLETSATLMARAGGVLHAIDRVVLALFVGELALRIGACGARPWRFFADGWNVFDFVIVAVCLLPVQAEFAAVLRLARQVSARSGGAFDATVQPLWATWQRAHAQRRKPTPAELAAARALVDWRAVAVSDQEVRLGRAGMALTLNGIAQGYAAERTRALLQAHGIGHALLDTGEWAPIGQAPDGQPWRLGRASPRDSARILATLRAD
ncbi:MAG: hypothetical protein CFE45_37980, partial [Burkholderiales bacterium PBB5]